MVPKFSVFQINHSIWFTTKMMVWALLPEEFIFLSGNFRTEWVLAFKFSTGNDDGTPFNYTSTGKLAIPVKILINETFPNAHLTISSTGYWRKKIMENELKPVHFKRVCFPVNAIHLVECTGCLGCYGISVGTVYQEEKAKLQIKRQR